MAGTNRRAGEDWEKAAVVAETIVVSAKAGTHTHAPPLAFLFLHTLTAF
jgi:hypothetical protein